MEPNRIVDTLSEAIADLQVLGREAAADSFYLKIGIEAIGKILIGS